MRGQIHMAPAQAEHDVPALEQGQRRLLHDQLQSQFVPVKLNCRSKVTYSEHDGRNSGELYRLKHGSLLCVFEYLARLIQYRPFDVCQENRVEVQFKTEPLAVPLRCRGKLLRPYV